MTVDLTGVAVAKRPRELAHRLRRELRLPSNQNAYGVAQVLGGLPGSVAWLVAFLLPSMLLRLLVEVRMHWFMRQQYLAPASSGKFSCSPQG